jgi:hypothetical protein
MQCLSYKNTPILSGIRVAQLSVCCAVYLSAIVLSDLRHLITPLISLNVSKYCISWSSYINNEPINTKRNVCE